mmetsp:Transcript_916/g.2018  ORF Transcript_916/g.2018 Transcript_916/m.2018 type:complete len:205 (+) Transcript_916:393-1007(+)
MLGQLYTPVELRRAPALLEVRKFLFTMPLLRLVSAPSSHRLLIQLYDSSKSWKDPDVWTGRDAEEWRPSPATEDDVRRSEKLSASDPLLLVAHASTRSMGDLRSGTVWQGGRDGHSAWHSLRCYDLEKISPQSLKDLSWVAVEDIHLDDRNICQMVDEAIFAFALHMPFFQEIDVSAGESKCGSYFLGDTWSLFDVLQKIDPGS